MTTATEPCRSCKKPVRWARHERTNKPAPIDADPSPQGNCRLDGSTYAILTKDALEDARVNGEALHTNHFMTCSEPERWKRS